MMSHASEEPRIEDAKPPGQSRDPPPDPELRWVEICERAARAFATGRIYAAADYWRQAGDLAHVFESGDPRRAASLNNLGVAARCRGDPAQASGWYRQAEAAWWSAIDGVHHLRPLPRARSSLFHLRMETRHRRDYDRSYIDRYRLWLGAGLAATLNNSAELIHVEGHMRDAERGYRRALLARSLAGLAGDGGPAMIRANLESLPNATARAIAAADAMQTAACAPGFTAQAVAKGWLIDTPPVFTDEGRLMAALLCTRLVLHTSLPSIRDDA
ncbi:MAG: hypothetical protein ACREVE_06650 [Gammaproteobacteria bacterium]